MKKNLKKISNFLILIIFTTLVLYFSLKDNFNDIVSQIMSINKINLILCFMLMISYWLLKSLVLKKIANKYNKNYSYKNAFRLIMEVNFFNAITPFATGGQPYEIYSLKKHDIRIMDSTNVVLQNFIVYQIALVLLGIFALIYNHFFSLFPNDSILRRLITLGFIINTLIIVGLFIFAYAKRLNHFIVNTVIRFLGKIKVIKNPSKTASKFSQSIEDFHEGSSKLLENKFEFISLIFYHLLSLCVLYLIPFVLLLGTGNNLSFNAYESIVTSAYVMLIGSFVPIPGATGGLEYGFVQFYGYFVKGPVLNAIMLMWRFITYYFGLILGSIILNVKENKKCE